VKPVDQDTFHVPGFANGNCMAACIASLFEVDLDEDVPNFVDFEGPLAWWDAARSWCRTRGYDLIRISSLDQVTRWADRPPGDHAIAGVPSPRGPWGHCVIVDRDGVVVHDPYPGGPTGHKAEQIDEVYLVVEPYEPFPTQPADREEAS